MPFDRQMVPPVVSLPPMVARAAVAATALTVAGADVALPVAAPLQLPLSKYH